MNRREFLKSSSTVLAAASAVKYIPTTFAADKVRRVGLIGPGWYGKGSLFRLLQVEPVEVVSLCDVDRKMLSEAADLVAERQKSHKKPRMFGDFREMLKEKDLDIVMVSTPDHWHALASIEAMRAGADVYVEKPTAVDIVESQSMVAAARKYNRVVQVNTQRRSTPHLVEAVNEIVKPGKLGKIKGVDVFCYWHMRNTDTAASAPEIAAPENLDYEMWTGPAPMRPFTKINHPRGWRAFTEYGNGIVGDMCVHMLDMVRWMLDLGAPNSVTSWGGILHDRGGRANISDTQTATFDFGELQVVWNHRTWGSMPDQDWPWAAIIQGEKGTLKASVFKYEFTPNDGGPRRTSEAVLEYDKYPEDKSEKDLERHVASAMRAHWRNYLSCVDQRTRPVADIEHAHVSSTACILANMSAQVGRTLKWDPATHTCVNDPEANALLRRPYRAPWVHPEPGNV